MEQRLVEVRIEGICFPTTFVTALKELNEFNFVDLSSRRLDSEFWLHGWVPLDRIEHFQAWYRRKKTLVRVRWAEARYCGLFYFLDEPLTAAMIARHYGRLWQLQFDFDYEFLRTPARQFASAVFQGPIVTPRFVSDLFSLGLRERTLSFNHGQDGELEGALPAGQWSNTLKVFLGHAKKRSVKKAVVDGYDFASLLPEPILEDPLLSALPYARR